MVSISARALKEIMKLILTIKKFLQEESGQTTTEYFLILAVIVTIFMQFRKKLIKVLDKLMGGVESATDKAFEEVGNE